LKNALRTLADPGRIGLRYYPAPASLVANLIAKGEGALLDALVSGHSQTRKLEFVAHIIDLPSTIGTESKVLLADTDAGKILYLIDTLGTPPEHRIVVLLCEADAMPCTHQLTITGGLYVDGPTVGI
jgi:hypothetical protein